MSVTINIAGKHALLADGQWRSADVGLRELLNAQLATLEIPGHWPPRDRELELARHACRDFDGMLIDVRSPPWDPHGAHKVY